MKNIIIVFFIFLFLFIDGGLLAQPVASQNDSSITVTVSPVKNNTIAWGASLKQLNGSEYLLVLNATLSSGYHLYSMEEVPDQLPVATAIILEQNDSYEIMGKVFESDNRIQRYDSAAEMSLLFFEKFASFTQKIKVLKNEANVKVQIYFMTCNDHLCVPPDTEIIQIMIKK